LIVAEASGLKEDRMKTARRVGLATVVVVLLALVAGQPAQAVQQWWDTGTTNTPQGGIGVWSTVDAYWATNSTLANGHTLSVWTNGNDAVFACAAPSIVTVSNVSVGNVSITGTGAVTFLDGGAGAMTINGTLTNTGVAVMFSNNIALGGNQAWYLTKSVTLCGAVTGAYVLAKSGIGGTLVLSNAANQLSGLTVIGDTVQAYNGGNALGGASSVVTLGQTNQTSLAVLGLNTTVAGNTTYSMGNLVNAGVAQLTLNTAVAGSTNILSAGSLARTSGIGAILMLMPQNGLGTREQVTFSSAPTPVSGMLSPWIVDSNTANFVTYGTAGLTDVVYDATQANPWNAAKKVNLTGTATVNQNTNVYAMKVGKDVTVNSGAILSNASGGFIITGGNILGGGTVDVGANELLAYVTGTRLLAPTITGSGGLTLFGGGTLTLSNMTYTGDTWIDQGTLTIAPWTNQTYAGAINGLGTLALGGPAMLVLSGTNTLLGGITASTGFKLAVNGNLFTTNTVNLWSGSGNNGLVTSTNAVGQGGTWDLRKQAVNIGTSYGSSLTNLLTLNNVTVTNVGTVYIGQYVNDNGNGLIVSNGARFYSGNVYVGVPGNNPGAGYNNYYQVGGAGAAVTVVNTVIQLGGAYTTGAIYPSTNNTLTVTNANLTATGLYVGYRESTNNAAYILANSTVNLSGGPLSIGNQDTSGHATAFGNVLTIDSGVLTNVGTVNIGNGNNATANAISNALNIVNGGQFYSGPVKVGNLATDSNNVYNVGGYGAASSVSNGTISVIAGGTMTVTNATLSSGTLTLGGNTTVVNVRRGAFWNMNGNALTMGSGAYTGDVLAIDGGIITNAGTLTVGSGASSVGNSATITNGGQVYATSVSIGASSASSNTLSVAGGTLLEAGLSLTVGAGLGNSFTDAGGILQFTTGTPTIASNGNLLAVSNGTISFRNVTNANVKGNWLASLTNITFSGINTFRLANATNNSPTNQTYTFDPNLGPTNYWRLEMVNGGTAYTNGSVTIGQAGTTNGWLLFSNTTARMWGAVTNNGTMKIVDSTVTFMTNLTLGANCTLLWTSNSVGNAVNVNGTLTLPTTATLNVSGSLNPTAVMPLFQSTNAIVGTPSAWSVTPAGYKVTVNGNRLMLRPRVTGFLLIAE